MTDILILVAYFIVFFGASNLAYHYVHHVWLKWYFGWGAAGLLLAGMRYEEWERK